MISYKKAISLIKKNSITLTSKKIFIKKALYKICAKDILSPSKYPSFDNSAFDGFALVSRETKGLNSKTGVEMEALSGVNSALLAIYDLSKIVEPNLKITNIRLLVKSGGKKGLWINPNGIPEKIKKVLNL